MMIIITSANDKTYSICNTPFRVVSETTAAIPFFYCINIIPYSSRKSQHHFFKTQQKLARFCVQAFVNVIPYSNPAFAFIIARTFKGSPNRLMKPALSLWLYSSWLSPKDAISSL